MYDLWNAITQTVIACGVSGVIVACLQWRSEIKANRAEQLMELLDRTRCDEVAQIFSVIDWDVAHEAGLTYDDDKKFHLSSGVKAEYPDLNDNNIEFRIDRMLGLYSHVCYLRFNNVFSDTDMKNFDYRITRLCQHKAIRDYLCYLYQFTLEQHAEMSFMPLVNYCIKTGKIRSNMKRGDN